MALDMIVLTVKVGLIASGTVAIFGTWRLFHLPKQEQEHHDH